MTLMWSLRPERTRCKLDVQFSHTFLNKTGCISAMWRRMLASKCSIGTLRLVPLRSSDSSTGAER